MYSLIFKPCVMSRYAMLRVCMGKKKKDYEGGIQSYNKTNFCQVDFQFSIGLILVALKSEMSRCQIANPSK